MLAFFSLFYLSYSLLINEDFTAQFVKNYNSGNYSSIFGSFYKDYQRKISYKDFVADLQSKKSQYGNIMTFIPQGIENRKGILYEYRAILAFEKKNATGVLVQLQGWNKILNASIQTTTKWLSLLGLINNDNRFSLSLTINDTEINYQENIAVPIGSSDMIWILMEYAQQVGDGTLNGSTIVQREEVAKYYMDGFDIGYKRSKVLQADNFTLDQLVSESLNQTIWAAQEYLVGLLGFDNISDRKSSLGLDTITSYPVSARYGIAIEAPLNSTEEVKLHENLTTDLLKNASYSLRKASVAQNLNGYVWWEKPARLQQALKTMFGDQVDQTTKDVITKFVNETSPLFICSNSLKTEQNSYAQMIFKKQVENGTNITIIAGMRGLDAKEFSVVGDIFGQFLMLIQGSADYMNYVLSLRQ